MLYRASRQGEIRVGKLCNVRDGVDAVDVGQYAIQGQV
jgi:hypothetical protein